MKREWQSGITLQISVCNGNVASLMYYFTKDTENIELHFF